MDYLSFSESDAWMFLPSELSEMDNVEELCEITETSEE